MKKYMVEYKTRTQPTVGFEIFANNIKEAIEKATFNILLDDVVWDDITQFRLTEE